MWPHGVLAPNGGTWSCLTNPTPRMWKKGREWWMGKWGRVGCWLGMSFLKLLSLLWIWRFELWKQHGDAKKWGSNLHFCCRIILTVISFLSTKMQTHGWHGSQRCWLIWSVCFPNSYPIRSWLVYRCGIPFSYITHWHKFTWNVKSLRTGERPSPVGRLPPMDMRRREGVPSCKPPAGRALFINLLGIPPAFRMGNVNI